MAFTARIWKNTGFNGINIPDSPALLESLPYEDLPVLDLLSDAPISEIKVHGTINDTGPGAVNLGKVDYVRIGNRTYYNVFEPPYMLNGDTVVIPLTVDGVLSAGGINSINFLDGIASRASTETDNFGDYCIEDELLVTSQPLKLEVVPLRFDQNSGGQSPSTIYCETTLDLGMMACLDGSVVYSDETMDPEKSCIVPHSYPKMGQHTKYNMREGLTNLQGIDTGTTVFKVPSENDGTEIIPEGIQKCRGLGIESAIFNQVCIPDTFVDTVEAQQSIRNIGMQGAETSQITFPMSNGNLAVRQDVGHYNGFGSEDSESTYYFVKYMDGVEQSKDTTLSFEYSISNYTVKNKRVLYGNNNKFGILTNAGNRFESNPEDLLGGNRTSPYIVCKADPHLDGCPYYRFEYMNGSGVSNSNFWFNCVKGLKWKTVPLIFSQASGTALNRMEYENSRRIKDYEYETAWTGGRGAKAVGAMGEFIDKYGNAVKAGVAGVGVGALYTTVGEALIGGTTAIAGGITSAAAALPLGGAIGAAAIAGDKIMKNQQNYLNEKLQEASSFLATANVASPTIQIGYDNEAFRDFYGEVTFVYRYRPYDYDIKRMDKILTMYGYKVALPINDVNLNSRTKFNYIEAEVTVGGGFPMWLKKCIQAQISAGCRIWHKVPDYTDYTTGNPIRT